jgi:hypothetical protein
MGLALRKLKLRQRRTKLPASRPAAVFFLFHMASAKQIHIKQRKKFSSGAQNAQRHRP